MIYPNTIMEVDELEEEFRISGRKISEYIFITTQLKVNIYEKYNSGNRNTKEFKDKMHSSMKKVKELLANKKI